MRMRELQWLPESVEPVDTDVATLTRRSDLKVHQQLERRASKASGLHVPTDDH